MSYLPSPYTGYFTRIDNTMISGSQLLSYLSKDDMRALEFSASIASPPVIVTSATPGTAITAQQLIQAVISTQGINCSVSSGFINLGTCSQSQAAAYVSLFNLRSTNDVRTMKFYNSTSVNSLTSLYVSGSGSDVLFRQSNNTASEGLTSTLFGASGTATVGTALSGVVGSERIVEVFATDLSSGSQNVVFNILTNSQ
jgi:hypothetical protein